MSADVDLSAHARIVAEACDACGRTAPRAEMIVDADPDTESGWLCAEGFGCLVRHAPVLRVAGIAVTPEVLAAAPSETSAAHAEAAASAVRSAARKAKASRGFSALADAELLVGGSAHVAPAAGSASQEVAGTGSSPSTAKPWLRRRLWEIARRCVSAGDLRPQCHGADQGIGAGPTVAVIGMDRM